MKFENNKCYDVCWRGKVVKPGETVEDKPKKTKKLEVIEDGVE